MTSPLRADLARAAGSPARDLDMEAVIERSDRLGRRRKQIAGVGVLLPLLVVVLVAWVATGLRDERAVGTVLEVPPAGQASGQFLDDGTPVWVTQTAEGEIHVLEAQQPDMFHAWATHQVDHCNRVWLESWWGSAFELDGTAVAGPSAEGLRRYEITRVEGDHLAVDTLDPNPGRRDHGLWSDRLPLSCDPAVVTPHPAWADSFDEWHVQSYGDELPHP